MKKYLTNPLTRKKGQTVYEEVRTIWNGLKEQLEKGKKSSLSEKTTQEMIESAKAAISKVKSVGKIKGQEAEIGDFLEALNGVVTALNAFKDSETKDFSAIESALNRADPKKLEKILGLKSGGGSKLGLILAVTLPIVFVLVLVVGFTIYRKRKHPVDDLENKSSSE